MPITKDHFGKHKNVLILEFGVGDIFITPGVGADDEMNIGYVGFSRGEPGQVGRDTGFKGETSNEIEDVKCVFKFDNIQSIDAVIYSLNELKKEMLLERDFLTQ